MCEWGAIERVQPLGKGKIIGLDTTVRTGAIMVRKDSKFRPLADLANVPIAVTWHAGTFYAAIEVLEAAGVPFDDIKLVHANDRLDALLDGKTEAAALMEPLVSRAAGSRRPQDRRPALARRHRRRRRRRRRDGREAAPRAQPRRRLAARERGPLARRSCCATSSPSSASPACMPELLGVQAYQPDEFHEKVDWMLDRGFLDEAPAYGDIVSNK